MTSHTFTQLQLRQRFLFRVFIPLLALFAGLAGAQTAQAAVIFSGQGVTLNQGDGNITYSAATYDGSTLSDRKPGSTTTPLFDINSGQLLLNGGTVTTTETAPSVVNGASLTYTLYSPSFTVLTTGTIALVAGGISGGVRTFALSNANINLLSFVPTGATGYSLAISYQASFLNNGTPPPRNAADDNGGSNYNATFGVTGSVIPVPTLTSNTIFIAPNAGANVAYGTNPPTSRPFQGNNLSDPANSGTSYNVNIGQLLLNGGTATTTESGPNIVSNVFIYYRVRTTNSGGGAFQSISLTRISGANGGTKVFSLSTAQLNLIASGVVTAAGTYSIDTYFQATGINTTTGVPFTLTDPTTGTYYTASFVVSGMPIAETIWVGGKDDNWFDSDNWSAGVPNEMVNALVRDLGAGSAVPYPNIYAGLRRTTADGTLIYDNSSSGPAKARNLTMGGTSQASRSLLRLIYGRLEVSGSFDNAFSSFIQSENTVIAFNGAAQNITGGTFTGVEIGGSGTKITAGIMNIAEFIRFTGGILATNVSTPLASTVILAGRTIADANNGAQLIGETNRSYLRGVVRITSQAVLANQTRTYGNIGMTLTFTSTTTPGDVEVTRNTAESYTPLNGKYSVRRIFSIRPADQQSNAAGLLQATMVFGYQNIDTRALGPNNANRINEENLSLYLSTNDGNTFGQLGRDVLDTLNNTLTKYNVRTFANFTLGDITNPLPVTLSAFDVARLGNDGVITWATATEKNNKGFDVQVSTNGSEFRTLASVASQATNSDHLLKYRYVDTESNKTGVRYYRLRQVDIDGKEAFFAPKTINFGGAVATENKLTSYPNPFTSELHIAFVAEAAGQSQVTLSDMTGRVLNNQQVMFSTGTNDITLANMDNLQGGIYLVRAVMPSGKIQTLKVVKK